ncbi:MAG: RcnB family protein [Janthinobacterium lividum]
MKKIISSMLMAAALASSAVYAQQGPDQGPDGNGNHGGQGQGQMHGGQGRDQGNSHDGQGMHADRGGPGGGGWQGGPGGPGGEWHHRGGRLPGDYRDRQYVVDDWRGYDLQPPPRGYHWVGVGGEYLLVGIASGVIAQIITGR